MISLVAGVGVIGSITSICVCANEDRRLRLKVAEVTQAQEKLVASERELVQRAEKLRADEADYQVKAIDLTNRQRELWEQVRESERIKAALHTRQQQQSQEIEQIAHVRALEREAALEAEYQQKANHLAEQLAYVYAQRDRLIHWRKELEHKEGNLENTLSCLQETMWASLSKQAEDYVQQLAQEQSKPLETWKEKLQKQQEVLKDAIATSSRAWRKKFEAQEKEYQALYEQVVNDCNEKIDHAQKQIAEAHQWYRTIYSTATTEAFKELHELKYPELPPPEVYEYQPKASLVAERTLKFLHEKEIYLDYCDSYEEKGGFCLFLKPKKQHQKFVEDYHAIAKLLPALQGFALSCNAHPQFGIYKGGFKLDFDVTGLTSQQRAARVRSKEIEEPASNWLEEVIKYTYHFRVNGQTRAGKSTFVNNLIGLMKRMFDKPVEVILIDPKYPMSRWSIKPKFKGLEESIIGLKEMADEVQRRLKLATEDADNDREIREFEPVLYVLDEADTVAGEYNDPTPPVAEYLESLQLSTKKSVAHLLKQGLKVGAALKVMVCYIGQSPLCTTLGMNRNDFNHSANFFLGENIPTAIEEVALKHQQPYLKQQYRLRIERYMEAKGTEHEKKHRYFGLVKVPGEPAFLASLPPEGAYDKEVSFAFVGAGGDGSLDSDDPEDIRRFARTLEASLHKASDGVSVRSESEPDLGKTELLPWTEEADPAALVESAKARIVALILEGIDKPSEICKMIWGSVINTSAKPYNARKGGVKKRIEFIVSEVKKDK